MVEAEDLRFLKALALMGGHKGPIWVSSQVLSRTLSLSPQTVSRRLKSLETQMLIERSVRADGQYVTITENGERELQREYSEYARIFGREKRHYVLSGTVISGVGEGRYYMSLPEYRRQFLERLGFEPFPGTLNIKLDPASMQIRRKIDALDWEVIRGFEKENRTFGDARARICRIDSIPCAMIVPGRTHYPDDIIEVIAPVELRTALNLSDSDRVNLEITYD
ncbi:MAG: DUF120 domain-containing protein [Methanomicrobiales archaeon]|nr:DUF120 domain-containing protein [Methanomicrobiales archaeon]MDI6875554.1 DUF120 domain-containing protein [Methanomicrobiales archaeon]